MTLKKFYELIDKAQVFGQLEKVDKVETINGTAEKRVYKLENFLLSFVDGMFVEMTDLTTTKRINPKDLTEETADETQTETQSETTNETAKQLETMTDEELQQTIQKASKILKEREIDRAEKVIVKFERAFENLKQFGELRIKVDATGDTKNFTTTVERLKLRILKY